MTSRLIITAAWSLALLLPGVASAQRRADSVQVGSRVRVWIPESAPQEGAPFIRRQMIRGEVTRSTPDTLTVRPSPDVGELAVPVAQIRRLDISRGVPSRARSAVEAAIGGAIATSLWFGLSYSLRDDDFGVNSRGQAFALGAGAGFVVGGILGALAPTERWRRLRR